VTELPAGVRAARGYAVPCVQIVSAYTELGPGPVTLYKLVLIAGDGTDGVLVVRTRVDEDPLICLHAPPGGTARFEPAAPTVINGRLQIHVSGADAVGSITFR
jgi:hypothetical protein